MILFRGDLVSSRTHGTKLQTILNTLLQKARKRVHAGLNLVCLVYSERARKSDTDAPREPGLVRALQRK